MFPFRFLLLLFVLVPFVEIYLLIEIGSQIGAAWTIFFVVLTAVIGAWLVRMQGMAALTRVQISIDHGQLPARELIEGLFLLIAGALLLTPGFFTDFTGFALLVPPLRSTLADYLLKAGVIRAAGNPKGTPDGGRGRPGGNTLEGEFRRVDK
ncbi:MAG: hypothetical protein DHS20C01_11110 [marine bacterium B5-7]|nr:MAG: hypothetical protein DHS20C01_11110 [marine bacterium B5-7]